MNLLVGTHKHSNEDFRDGYDKTFGDKKPTRGRWVMRDGKLVPMEENVEASQGITLIRDLDQTGQSYQSPTSFEWITSRRAMREDLKISGCRQVDPTEKKSFYNRERS